MLQMPEEGRNFIARYLLRREIFDRDEDLMIGLFTNTVAGLTQTLAGLTEPSGIGYEQLPVDDLDWSVGASGVANGAVKEFVAGSGGWTGIVQGYFLRTNAVNGTPRLIAFEFDGQQQLAAGQLTRLGNIATCVTPIAHGLATGKLVNITGAAQSAYNGIFPVTVTGSNSFTYTVSGSPASPATGVILVNRCFQMDVGAIYRVTPALTVGA